ncbi:hypothetical protein BDV24DRAFT_178466 [Aspergillus arachidicola]|uniref:Major facilitator superfamily (MFS) profile domain-containing protein n=1 Tax=Aspergillus arachidicola TaxID=656916 RepID=A0A5N6XUC9_9EURO|nr:hypothetical protein BDV24DRAFT_178466 [Aspergillus arachidicola]
MTNDKVFAGDSEHLEHQREGMEQCQNAKLGAMDPVDSDPHEMKKLVRKIDLRLMPIMCITYGLQYYDKVVLSHAAIFGLLKDLDLVAQPTRYSNVSMIFYCGYLVGSLPISYLAQIFPTGIVCGTTVVLWSVVVMCTPACTSYQGLLVNRFFLGLIESGVAPSFMLVVSAWYTKREQVLRSGLWYSFSGGANLVVPVISFGIGHIKSAHIASWKLMFLIPGACTFLWSIVVFFFLPHSPTLIIHRMQADNAGMANREFKKAHVYECMRSLSFWIVNLLSMLTSVVSGPISSFGSLIFNEMGFTPEQSLLLSMPNGAMAFICIFGSAYIPRNFSNSRLFVIAGASLVVVMGCCLTWRLPLSNNAGRLAGFYLMNFFSSAYIQVVGLGTSNVGGYTKKATSAASIFVFYCIGSIIGPVIFNQKEAPRYNSGFMGTMICLASAFVLAIALRFHLERKNALRNETYGQPGVERGLEDITDRENKDFRYHL